MGRTGNNPFTSHLFPHNFNNIKSGYVSTSNTLASFQQLPIEPGVPLASTVSAPILHAVEVTMQTHVMYPRIHQLIEAVSTKKASIEKENTVSNTIKRLRHFIDEVYNEVLLAKHKKAKFYQD